MKSCPVAVIGHVDHGKTSLVRALTGQETDRLAEEKSRGLSITLGFAHRAGPSGIIDFIDAPGHEDFIRAMVCGSTGAQAVLMVISAVDGIQPQTTDHLTIAKLLGITRGVVALTKCDLVPFSSLADRARDIETALSGTVMAGQPIVCCSSTSGAGLEDLAAALDDLIAITAPEAFATDPPFLPIDRVFSVPGRGAVVTGTLLGGALKTDAHLSIGPMASPVTVRGLECRGQPAETALAGTRVAANLRGVSEHDIQRGDVLFGGLGIAPSKQIDVSVTLLETATRPLKHMDKARLLIGTESQTVSMRTLDTKPIALGSGGLVQLRAERPLVVRPGQRFVLRRLSPAETIGGGRVLDNLASPARGRMPKRITLLRALDNRSDDAALAAMAALDGGLVTMHKAARLLRLSEDQLSRLVKQTMNPLGNDTYADPKTIDSARAAYLSVLLAAHADTPFAMGHPVTDLRARLGGAFAEPLVEHVERILVDEGEIKIHEGQVSLTSHDPFARLTAADKSHMHALLAALKESALMPPDPAELTERLGADAVLIDALVGAGDAVQLYNQSLKKRLVFDAGALINAAEALRAAFPPPAVFTTGEARAALGTTRKYIVPILEAFDAQGYTRRAGDTRTIID